MSLVRQDLLCPDRAAFPGEEAFRFRHLLIRDAAYEAISKADRTQLHERFARWLEVRGTGLGELGEIAGYHLIRAGWVPAGLVLGISIGSRHDDRKTARQARWGSGNAEVAGWTELVTQSRHDARRQLESEVKRLGAEGVVIATIQMRLRERDCPESVGRRDHIVEATLIGTAVARFFPAEQPHDGPALAIMSLDPHRRQAARVQIWVPQRPPQLCLLPPCSRRGKRKARRGSGRTAAVARGQVCSAARRGR